MATRTTFAILITTVLLTGGCAPTPPAVHEVHIVGAMTNVMRKGQLQATLHLDTIAVKAHLYGFGPVAYLAGEILIVDGTPYRSTVRTDTTMRVEETWDITAPFFAYANVARWKEHPLPDTVRDIPRLEAYLQQATRDFTRPFLFKLAGTVARASIHVMDLPAGATVSSPAEAHQHQKDYTITNQSCDIIGFFSNDHKSIFTHHDTYLHLHLITGDRRSMGHLDELNFETGQMKLYLPADTRKN